MFTATTTLRSAARPLRNRSLATSPVHDRLTAQRDLAARKAACAQRTLKVKSLKLDKLAASKSDELFATAKVERPITLNSSGSDASNTRCASHLIF